MAKLKKKNNQINQLTNLPINHQGFTLIELLVATSLFVVVVMIVSGVFLSTVNAQRKIIAMSNVQESASFILESMAKEIRMSVVDRASGGNILRIQVANDEGTAYEYVTYEFLGSNIIKSVGSVSGGSDISSPQAVNPTNITVSGSFSIQTNDFPLRNKVAVVLHAESQNRPAQKAIIDLQTSMTPRGPQDNY